MWGCPGRSFGGPIRPSDIANLGLWLDAQDPYGTGQTAVDGTPVSTWTDKSGLGNHATQGTLDRQPLFAVNGLNGRPSMRFDGINDWFDVPNLFKLNAVTCFLVGQSLPEALTQNAPFITGTDHRFYIWRTRTTGDDSFMFALGLDSFFPFELHYEEHFTPVDNEPHTFMLWNNGLANGVEGFVDGISVGPGTKSGSYQPNKVQLGTFKSGEMCLDGYIAEVLIYNRRLSDVERIAVEGYLADKWGKTNVPEPSSLGLLGLGGLFLISIACLHRRQRTRW